LIGTLTEPATPRTVRSKAYDYFDASLKAGAALLDHRREGVRHTRVARLV
jgi:hypothetical protein